MTVQELFRAGQLKETIQALGNEVRDNPADSRRRTFLFELLCFAGDYSRAEKHLNLLADANPDATLGALVYRSALRGERERQAFFEGREYLKASAPPFTMPRSGKLNGEPFRTLEDADPRVGSRLEVFIAGEYVWIPFEHIGSLTMGPPKLLRDLLWSAAIVKAGPAMSGKDFGEVLLPVLHPFSWQHPRDPVKLGRETDWLPPAGDDVFEIPYGQKLLVVDGERAVPYLEIRSLQFDDSVEADEEETTADAV